MPGPVKILGLDPGPERTGIVGVEAVDGAIQRVQFAGTYPNPEVRALLRHTPADVVALEMIASYGMPVGASTFETCVWIGRFEETIDNRPDASQIRRMRFTRPQVQRGLCFSTRARAANIRQALIDLIGPVGTKKAPGPLYGVTTHAWSALAIATLAAQAHHA